METHTRQLPAHEALRLGVSACLLGQEVRWDGGHKRDAYIVDTLGAYFVLVPVCPEVESGLGVPRPPIHLVGTPVRSRAIGAEDPDLDVSAVLREHARQRAESLGGLCGHILKSDSPSCGMAGVKVSPSKGGAPRLQGTGLYAGALMKAHPLLPVTEERGLSDPVLRDNFIERVFAYQRWQAFLADGVTTGRLADFHRRHRLTLMVHGSPHALGRLDVLANGMEDQAPSQLAGKYGVAFMAMLKRPATRRRHAAVLRHLTNRLQEHLHPSDRMELTDLIARYRQGQVGRLVPLHLLQHHFRRHPQPDLEGQAYLQPHPAERALRWGT